MGLGNLFKKKNKEEPIPEMTQEQNMGLDEDPFKSDPFMDPNSGLNLPQENPQNMQQNQNPFKKYSQQNFEQENPHPGFDQNAPQQNNEQNTHKDFAKDLEIIIAKLDAIKAEVHTMNHRIENIERRQQKKMW